jgi:hypothetical protein
MMLLLKTTGPTVLAILAFLALSAALAPSPVRAEILGQDILWDGDDLPEGADYKRPHSGSDVSDTSMARTI